MEAGRDVYSRFFWWPSHWKRVSEGTSDGEGRLLEGSEAGMTLSTEASRRPGAVVGDGQGRLLMIDVESQDKAQRTCTFSD
jgi:hypothetical protein